MKRNVQGITIALSAAMLLAQGAPLTVMAADAETKTAFEEAFAAPDQDSRPIMRWWIAPGRMNEEEVKKEIQNFAEKGYGRVELQCLEMAKDCVINDETWNETMKWIMTAAKESGITVDFTVGQMWPVATPEITDLDDVRAEQQIWQASAEFTAAADAKTYSAAEWMLPTEPIGSEYNPQEFDTERAFQKVAVTAVKAAEDGSLDAATAVTVPFDEETGAVEWEAPEEGTWKIFYFTSQTAGHTTQFIGQVVIDHMSPEGTQAVIDNWEKTMESDPELKALYEENAGSIFGDSFELRTNLWTPKMLEEFQARRGYDLTPYLPALFADLGSVGAKVQSDLYTTMTELLSENHMEALRQWAATHNMDLRYQAYSSAGESVFEITDPSLHVDIAEAESYAMSGTVPDSYRQLSGAVHMKGNKIYSAEAAEIGNDDWRETWTDTQLMSGSDARHLGMTYYANRLFAGGVNKLVFHGTTYKLTDFEGLMAPAAWPGYSAMALMNYGNEWDDKTPMWENADLMTDYLSRVQMALQQGTADMDLAVYRNLSGKGNIRDEMTALEKAGFTYDYVTPSVLEMDNAVVENQVLAAEGPSYKALLLEPMADGTVPTLPLETAKKILEYAKNGLPVLVIGEAPSATASIPGKASEAEVAPQADESAELQAVMEELMGLENVKTAADRDEAVAVLAELNVTPDAAPAEAGEVYFQHRAAEGAEIYYIYNDGDEARTETVTLEGVGTPYLLDAWSGEISPMAEYTANEGSVEISVELAAKDAVLVAVAQDGWSSKTAEDAVVRTASEEKIALNDWTMVLNQWVPADENDPYAVQVVPTQEYSLSQTDETKPGLAPWYEIDSENLTNAAGVAEYTATFELEKGWEDGHGAVLAFTELSDTGRLFVNGEEVSMNQIAKTADIGKYLVAGTNEIRVQVASNMSNVVYGKDSKVNWGMVDVPAADCTYAFGIIGDVTLTPYTVE